MYYAPLTRRSRARIALLRAARAHADARAYGAPRARALRAALRAAATVWRQTRPITARTPTRT